MRTRPDGRFQVTYGSGESLDGSIDIKVPAGKENGPLVAVVVLEDFKYVVDRLGLNSLLQGAGEVVGDGECLQWQNRKNMKNSGNQAD